MNLKEQIEDFNLDKSGGIDKEDKDGKMSEAFRPIAETILSGYFKVSKNHSDSYVTVHPTCVEIYYHEEGEGEDKIKDYIVYHRNSDNGQKKEAVFSLGVLHNHISGIDLTFERMGKDDNPIRFSALIREFWVDKSHKTEESHEDYGEEHIKAYTETQPEKRSTYLYEALYSQYSVFEGFSVQWVDGNEDEKKVIRSVKPRLNVAEYKMDNKDGKGEKPVKVDKAESSNGELTQNQKYKQCPRLWRYSINEDKMK